MIELKRNGLNKLKIHPIVICAVITLIRKNVMNIVIVANTIIAICTKENEKMMMQQRSSAPICPVADADEMLLQLLQLAFCTKGGDFMLNALRDEEGLLIEAEICPQCYGCDNFENCLFDDAVIYCRLHTVEACDNCVSECEAFC